MPHFEKILYDQAMTALVCVEAYEAYGDEIYRRMAEEIFNHADFNNTFGVAEQGKVFFTQVELVQPLSGSGIRCCQLMNRVERL